MLTILERVVLLIRSFSLPATSGVLHWTSTTKKPSSSIQQPPVYLRTLIAFDRLQLARCTVWTRIWLAIRSNSPNWVLIFRILYARTHSRIRYQSTHTRTHHSTPKGELLAVAFNSTHYAVTAPYSIEFYKNNNRKKNRKKVISAASEFDRRSIRSPRQSLGNFSSCVFPVFVHESHMSVRVKWPPAYSVHLFVYSARPPVSVWKCFIKL